MKKGDLKQMEELLDTKLEPVNQKLDSLTLDMIDVQKKTDVLPDLHSYIKDTSDEVKKLEERIETIESPAL